MGNYRFRFSDVIPNAWFYKLRDMAKNSHRNNTNRNRNRKKTSTKKSLYAQPPPPQPNNNNDPSESTKLPLPASSAERKSYHFPREISFRQNSPTKKSDFLLPAEPPRKSSRTRGRRRIRQAQPTPRLVSAGCSCRATLEDVVDSDPTVTSSDEHGSTLTERGGSDDEKGGNGDDVAEFDLGRHLQPIVTKKQSLSAAANPGRRGIPASSSSSPGVRLRTNAARMASRRIGQGRKSVSLLLSSRRTESFAVTKKSEDPGKDFRESMVEMIAENNIRAAKDLEELLACYLSLNSGEYHDIIVDVFKQIWFDTH